MKKQRKHYTPEEKVAILRRHLVEGVPISDLCDELGPQPTVLYRWQKEFFESGAVAFQQRGRTNHQAQQERIAWRIFLLLKLEYSAWASGQARRCVKGDVGQKQGSQLRKRQNDIAQTQGTRRRLMTSRVFATVSLGLAIFAGQAHAQKPPRNNRGPSSRRLTRVLLRRSAMRG